MAGRLAEVVAVGLACRGRLTGLGQLLGGVLADRLDEAVAGGAAARWLHCDPGAVDEAAQEVEGPRSPHGFGGGEVEAAGEDRQAPQQRLAVRVEEFVTP